MMVPIRVQKDDKTERALELVHCVTDKSLPFEYARTEHSYTLEIEVWVTATENITFLL